MASEQIKIGSSNKSFIVKHTQSTMDKISDLSQVTVFNFKHAKVGKSFIPSVPVNYTCSKQKKAGKSFIPRFAVIYSKQAKNGKHSISHVNSITYFNLEKDNSSISYAPINHCNPVKNRRSYIPRIKAAKKVEPLLYGIQEKTQQKNVEHPTSPLFGKSKIPVPTSTKKTNVSALNSAKKANSRIRTSALDKAKKGNACVSIQDDQVRVLTFNAVRRNDGQAHVLTYNVIKKDERISTLNSIKKSLIPVHKLTYTLFKKRVDPLQPSTLTTLSPTKKDALACASTLTSNKKANDIMRISLKNKHTTLQKSVNKPEASTSISHNKVEVSTTTSIIKPELSSISLLYKAEKDLSSIKHQAEENGDDVPSSLFGNVFKTIVRFGKDLFSKIDLI